MNSSLFRIDHLLISTITVILLFSSCMKQESYSDIPEIEYLGYYNVFDTGQYAKQGVLTIGFKDGNGDIGLAVGDTNFPFNKEGDYYYNFVIGYFEKQQGVFVKVDLNPSFSARIPILNAEEPGRAIKGFITDTLILNPKPVYDTIRFDVFIYDRALNKSNVVTTPEIIVSR